MDFQALLDEEKYKLKVLNSNKKDNKLKSFLFGKKKVETTILVSKSSIDDQIIKDKIKKEFDDYMNKLFILDSTFNFKSFNIMNYLTGKVPTCYYIPDIISIKDELNILTLVEQAPHSKWTVLSNRKLQSWGGIPSDKFKSEALPIWMKELNQFILSLNLHPFCPNHLLINRYSPGEGILPHNDGPIYYPLVAILSLGGGIGFKFSKKSELVNDKESFSLYVKPRSLLVFTAELYTDYLHSIDQKNEDFITSEFLNVQEDDPLFNKVIRRVDRTSLTIRYIPTNYKD